MEPISSGQLSPVVAKGLPPVAPARPEGDAFKNVLLEGLQHVNALQADAEQAVEALFTGGDGNTAEVLSAVKKAEMSFQLMMQMRNKLVQAYQEIRDIRI
jgi:flagellar hook-basal body complex protein FliE